MRKAKVRKRSLKLRLYVAGNAPNSLLAIRNIHSICSEHFTDAFELEVVDVLHQPRRGLEEGIIVTPTLVNVLPSRLQRVIGNLSDTSQVLLALAAE